MKVFMWRLQGLVRTVAVRSWAAKRLRREECLVLVAAAMVLIVPRLYRSDVPCRRVIPSTLLLSVFKRLNKNLNFLSCWQIIQHLVGAQKRRNLRIIQGEIKDRRPKEGSCTLADHSDRNAQITVTRRFSILKNSWYQKNSGNYIWKSRERSHKNEELRSLCEWRISNLPIKIDANFMRNKDTSMIDPTYIFTVLCIHKIKKIIYY